MSTQFNCQKQFYFKQLSLFKQLYITIQFSLGSFNVKNSLISNNAV